LRPPFRNRNAGLNARTFTKKARKITAAQYNGKSDTFYFHAEPNGGCATTLFEAERQHRQPGNKYG
jgi:hypothetical protein